MALTYNILSNPVYRHTFGDQCSFAAQYIYSCKQQVKPDDAQLPEEEEELE